MAFQGNGLPGGLMLHHGNAAKGQKDARPFIVVSAGAVDGSWLAAIRGRQSASIPMFRLHFAAPPKGI